MTTNPDSIVSQIEETCKQLIRSVQESEPGTSAFTAEALVFAQSMKMNALAMEAFLEAQAKHYHHSTTQDDEGRTLAYSGERSALFYSIFGEIRFSRSYYCGDGHGFSPMDAALNLPPKGQSDFLRKMVEDLSINMSYEDATAFVAKYFPVSTSTRGVQAIIMTDSQDAQSYYDQAPLPPQDPEATILVVQADNKGVPMVKLATKAAEADPMPGKPKGEPQREGKTKEATVVCVSTHTPFMRTPEEVRDSLFKNRAPDDKVYDEARAKPTFKRTWATMQGKEKALAQAHVWAQQAHSNLIVNLVALTDGGEALQKRVDERFTEYVRVLDLIHAIQYLWKAADAQFGKASKTGWTWVYDAVLRMLRGETQAIIDELDGWVEDAERPAVSKPIERSAGYFEKNIQAMKYDEYLAKGWPIATGIIEGACRHVVKDRCERSGMRWTEQGVEAFLRLRCIHQNGDWEAYHDFRMRQRQERVYGIKSNQNTAILEPNVCRFNPNHQRSIAV